MSEEMPTSVFSHAAPPLVRLMNNAVTCAFEEIHQAQQHGLCLELGAV